MIHPLIQITGQFSIVAVCRLTTRTCENCDKRKNNKTGVTQARQALSISY